MLQSHVFVRFTILVVACAAFTHFRESLAGEEDVLINEIMYHPPGDHENAQFVEIFNRGSTPVSLAGWKFTKGIAFTFPQSAQLAPGGFAVVARDQAAFTSQYGRNISIAGTFTGKLSRHGDRLELCNAQGRTIDSLRYSDHAPWPAGADGYGPSLERINPSTKGEDAGNWSCSKMPAIEKPAGTPGKQNDSFSAKALPVMSEVSFTPVGAGKELPVSVTASDAEGVEGVSLLFRNVSSGNPGATEQSVPMKRVSGDARKGVYQANLPAQKPGALVRFRVKASSTRGTERSLPEENDIRPTFTWFAHSGGNSNKVAQGLCVRTGSRESAANKFGGPGAALSSRGGAAFIYLPPNGGPPEVFDHIRINDRHGGFKVRFHKDHTLRGMTVVNIIFEGSPRWVLSEPLAYELYRMAGVPAEQTEHIRINLDGRQRGYMLLVEQPNKAFLARNQRDTSGDLFKLLWYGNGVVGKHEKKTNPTTGHDRLIKVIDGLNRTSGEAQWEFIQKNFNVEEFVNYFAVNMCIQNWDGFFNNYYAYQDVNGTGKWEIFPWDEDKTWGDYDGASSKYDWYEMPLSYGSKGDQSPRELRWLMMQGPFGGASWWRPAGYFSGPLLANPQFRQKFLRRVQELCQTVFTEEKFHPIIAAMENRLTPEIEAKAKATGENPEHALGRFRSDIQSFHNQVKHRRAFLLAEVQKQLKK